jgi:class 3 adenylate cyclase
MKTLRGKFFILILVPVLLTLVALTVWNYISASDLLVDQMDQTARHYLWASSESLAGNISSIRTVLRMEALDETLSDRTDPERQQLFVTLTSRLGLSVTSVFMGFPDGKFIRGASSRLPTDFDPRQRPWYRQALELPAGRVEGITAPYLDAGTHRPVITFFRKVMGPDRSLMGILGVDIDVLQASQSISQSLPAPAGGQKLLVASDGTILIHPDMQRVGRPLSATGEDLDQRMFDDIRNLDIDSRQYVEERRGESWYAGFHRVEGTDIALVFMVPAVNILSPLKRLHFEIIGLATALVITLLVLLMVMSRKIARPLLDLTRSAVSVADNGSYQDPLDVQSGDEVGQLTQAFNSMMEGLRQRDFIRETFGRYVTREVVEELLGTPDGLKLGGEVREVTIMFSDLRGFTPLSEHLGPEQVVDLLNRYLGRMETIITRHKGTINEFIGDAILTFFGAPVQHPDHARRAVACAVEMQLAMTDFNRQNADIGLPALSMGIGINTGEVIVGNIGSENRAKYGVVGHNINLASRVESATIGGQVLITQSTHDLAKAHLLVRGTRSISFKGVEEDLTLFDVEGVTEPVRMLLPDVKPEAEALGRPLPVMIHKMKAKKVIADPLEGTLTRFSTVWARVRLGEEIPPAHEIRLDVDETGSGQWVSVYAKVVEARKRTDSIALWLRISYVSPETLKTIKHLSML